MLSVQQRRVQNLQTQSGMMLMRILHIGFGVLCLLSIVNAGSFINTPVNAAQPGKEVDQIVPPPKSNNGFGDFSGDGGDLFDLSKPGRSKSENTTVAVVEARLLGNKESSHVLLELELKLPPDSYTYSTNEVKGFTRSTKISLTELKGVSNDQSPFKADRAPKIYVEEFLDNAKLEKYYDHVIWRKMLKKSDPQNSSAASEISLKGNIDLQYCNETNCINTVLEFNADEVKIVEAPLTIPSSENIKSTGEHKSETDLEKTGENLSVTVRPTRTFGGKETKDPVELTASMVKVNGKYTLVVSGVFDDSWYTYALDQDPETGAGLPCVLKIISASGISVSKSPWQPVQPPKIKKDDDLVARIHKGNVVWMKDFQLNTDPSGVADNEVGIEIELSYQLCNETQCLPPHKVSFKLNGDVSQIPDATETHNLMTEKKTGSTAENESFTGTPAERDGTTSPSFWPFIIGAALAGFGALTTPCVFPMIPITISVFLKQSETKGYQPVSMALIFCGGIVLGFTVLGLIIAVFWGASGITDLANNSILNLFFAAILIFFACSFLGMFEIYIPSSMLTWSSQQENRGGVIGILFMALTFTLISFTCTFGFVGLILVWAANGEYFWPIIGMLAFSTAFASPFFFLALFPSYLNDLPKSGGWMNSIKVTLGMLELGAALKFLSVVDLSFNPSGYIFDYTFVMCAWIVLSLMTGFYLLGMIKLPHDVPSEKISTLQFLAATLFLGFGIYLCAGVFAPEKPKGFIWEQIEAFAPPVIDSSPAYMPSDHPELANDPMKNYEGPIVNGG